MILKNLFLCEAATIAPDGTFSVLRGGVNVFNFTIPQNTTTENLPPIKITLIATVELEMTEMGKSHSLEIVLMDIDGKKILPELKSNFQAPISQKKGYHNILFDLLIPIKISGEYCFYVDVDNRELGSYSFFAIFHKMQ